ncbi:MAG: helix-turn-helix domain-containing protein [Bacteroidales bacterium]|nr:helix-turn-helix domain-containing protein [Bacteroidales bacterium]
MNRELFSIQSLKTEELAASAYRVEYYSLLLFKGDNRFLVDGVPYRSQSHTILFLAPYQSFRRLSGESGESGEIRLMQFHGDFYCIEYHKKEVACNGLLFNNIYLSPHIEVAEGLWNEVMSILEKINEHNRPDTYFEAIVKSYLQLILALSSKAKVEEIGKSEHANPNVGEMSRFVELIEKHFINERNVSFYAAAFSLTTDSFSKKVKKEFAKTPSQLIQERVTLEAKKLLHLTYKSVKEIAAALNFEDEFYFSRYFKKNVGLSPARYREKTGISIVAKKSME